MELTFLFVLLLIAVGVLCYIAGARRSDSLIESARADLKCADAEINGLRLSTQAQQKKYDDLYDAMLRVNQQNLELTKKLKDKSRSYEDLAEDIYVAFCMGTSRRQLSKLHGIPYPTLCSWIRRKELEHVVQETVKEVKQEQLLS